MKGMNMGTKRKKNVKKKKRFSGEVFLAFFLLFTFLCLRSRVPCCTVCHYYDCDIVGATPFWELYLDAERERARLFRGKGLRKVEGENVR